VAEHRHGSHAPSYLPNAGDILADAGEGQYNTERTSQFLDNRVLRELKELGGEITLSVSTSLPRTWTPHTASLLNSRLTSAGEGAGGGAARLRAGEPGVPPHAGKAGAGDATQGADERLDNMAGSPDPSDGGRGRSPSPVLVVPPVLACGTREGCHVAPASHAQSLSSEHSADGNRC